MADIIDMANDRAAQDLALALARATRVKPRGPAECEACDEPISEQRRDMGACLCVPCQSAEELRLLQAQGKRY
jgi:RNA polymerase-binding transcription factor DksA